MAEIQGSLPTNVPQNTVQPQNPAPNVVQDGSNAINLSSMMGKPWFNYVCTVVIILIVAYIVYIGYCHFVKAQGDDDEECEKEGFVEGQRQERDDPIFDYDVYKAVDKIRMQQEKIIRNLSQDVGL